MSSFRHPHLLHSSAVARTSTSIIPVGLGCVASQSILICNSLGRYLFGFRHSHPVGTPSGHCKESEEVLGCFWKISMMRSSAIVDLLFNEAPDYDNDDCCCSINNLSYCYYCSGQSKEDGHLSLMTCNHGSKLRPVAAAM